MIPYEGMRYFIGQTIKNLNVPSRGKSYASLLFLSNDVLDRISMTKGS